MLFAVFLLLAAGDASAQPKSPPKEKLVCQDDVRTGTRFVKRVCMTEEDAKRRSEASRKAMAEVQSRPATYTSKGN